MSKENTCLRIKTILNLCKILQENPKATCNQLERCSTPIYFSQQLKPIHRRHKKTIRIQLRFYHPRMWVVNNLDHLCLSVCLSVQAITFELLKLGTSFLVNTYVFAISRVNLSTKVIGSRLQSNA